MPNAALVIMKRIIFVRKCNKLQFHCIFHMHSNESQRPTWLRTQCPVYNVQTNKKNAISMMVFIECTLNSHSVEFDVWYCACMHQYYLTQWNQYAYCIYNIQAHTNNLCDLSYDNIILFSFYAPNAEHSSNSCFS